MLLYNQLTSQYLSDYFPELKKEIDYKMTFFEEELPHCLYADILNPFLKEYFITPKSENKKLVNKIFCFYENLAENGDSEVKNLLQVSLLEPLWDCKESYDGAQSFMGVKTKLIFNNISSYLNTPK